MVERVLRGTLLVDPTSYRRGGEAFGHATGTAGDDDMIEICRSNYH